MQVDQQVKDLNPEQELSVDESAQNVDDSQQSLERASTTKDNLCVQMNQYMDQK